MPLQPVGSTTQHVGFRVTSGQLRHHAVAACKQLNAIYRVWGCRQRIRHVVFRVAIQQWCLWLHHIPLQPAGDTIQHICQVEVLQPKLSAGFAASLSQHFSCLTTLPTLPAYQPYQPGLPTVPAYQPYLPAYQPYQPGLPHAVD